MTNDKCRPSEYLFPKNLLSAAIINSASETGCGNYEERKLVPLRGDNDRSLDIGWKTIKIRSSLALKWNIRQSPFYRQSKTTEKFKLEGGVCCTIIVISGSEFQITSNPACTPAACEFEPESRSGPRAPLSWINWRLAKHSSSSFDKSPGLCKIKSTRCETRRNKIKQSVFVREPAGSHARKKLHAFAKSIELQVITSCAYLFNASESHGVNANDIVSIKQNRTFLCLNGAPRLLVLLRATIRASCVGRAGDAELDWRDITE